MLLDNFYTILSSESSDSTTWTIQIESNPDHTVYQGHFPEHPVVPGIFCNLSRNVQKIFVSKSCK